MTPQTNLRGFYVPAAERVLVPVELPTFGPTVIGRWNHRVRRWHSGGGK